MNKHPEKMDCCINISPVKCRATKLKLQERPGDFSNFSLHSNNFWNKNKFSSNAPPKQKSISNFSKFHHTAYLESVQNVQVSSKARPRSASPYLPKISYLMKSQVQKSIKYMLSPRSQQCDQRSKNNRLRVASIFEKQSESLNGIATQTATFDPRLTIRGQEQKRNNVSEVHLWEHQRSISAFCLNLKRQPQGQEKKQCNSLGQSQDCIIQPRGSKSENLTTNCKTNFQTAMLNDNMKKHKKFEELRNGQREFANCQRNEREQPLSLILEQATDEEVSSISSQEKIEKQCNNNNEKNEFISNNDLRNAKLDLENNNSLGQSYISNQDVTISSDKSEINSQGVFLNEDINNKGKELDSKDVKFRVVTDLLNVNQQNVGSASNVCPKPNNYRRPSIVIDIVQKDSKESLISGTSRRSSSVPPDAKSQRKRQNPREIDLSNGSSINNKPKTSRTEQINKISSLIDSIKTKVFPDVATYAPDRKESAIWRASDSDQNIEDNVKFPKETKTAMMIMLNNSHRNPEDKDPLHSTRHYSKNYSRLPCPKNLLCGKGIHSGECDKAFRIVTPPNCSEKCICRSKMFWCPDCQNFWPDSARRIQNEVYNSAEMSIPNQDPLENEKSRYTSPQNRQCRTENFIATKNLSYSCCPKCGTITERDDIL